MEDGHKLVLAQTAVEASAVAHPDEVPCGQALAMHIDKPDDLDILPAASNLV